MSYTSDVCIGLGMNNIEEECQNSKETASKLRFLLKIDLKKTNKYLLISSPAFWRMQLILLWENLKMRKYTLILFVYSYVQFLEKYSSNAYTCVHASSGKVRESKYLS